METWRHYLWICRFRWALQNLTSILLGELPSDQSDPSHVAMKGISLIIPCLTSSNDITGSGLRATTSMDQRRSWEPGKPKHFQMSTQTSKLQTWRTIRIMVCVNFFRMGSAPLESQVSALSHQQRMPDAIRPGRGNQGGERMIDTSTVYYCTVYSRAKSTAKYLFFHQSVVGLLASGCEGTVSLFCVGIRRTARNCYHTLNMSYIWGCLRLRHGFDVASTSI